jgi:hypothetical protein
VDERCGGKKQHLEAEKPPGPRNHRMETRHGDILHRTGVRDTRNVISLRASLVGAAPQKPPCDGSMTARRPCDGAIYFLKGRRDRPAETGIRLRLSSGGGSPLITRKVSGPGPCSALRPCGRRTRLPGSGRR